MTTPVAAIVATVTGYLTAIATAAIVLFNINVTSEQQRALIAAIGALVSLAAFVYGAVAHKAHSNVETARLYATQAQSFTTELSATTTATPVHGEHVGASYPALDGDNREAAPEPKGA